MSRDTYHMRAPTCPHCGHQHADAWEWGSTGGDEETGEHECAACDRKFQWERHVRVSYSTYESHQQFSSEPKP